ncbi:hypothetical protein BBF96_15665 [Anoxybacter fermentans]|uniref:ABC transporter permease n=1 Tax=Anoxybacter fermentans TaxID=1323375 RepID=A0A3Q9HT28_9FIRM|nr:ABC-2 family transporter protein [Anoxybacter fermentans]AZR74679.1 hypothetical protein BBF96_15665 [Anoxybacter fermentans]
MLRYWKCFCAYFKANLLTWAEYRLDFLALNVSNIIYLVVGVINIEILFTQVDNIMGWNKYHIFWMLGFYYLVKTLWNTLFINTLDIGYWVRSGKLDLFMVRPLNPLFQLICTGRYNTEFALDELVLGLGLIIYANNHLGIVWDSGSIAYFIISLMSGVLVYGGIIFLLSCISLWTIQSDTLFEFIYNLERLIEYPIDIYGVFIKYFLTFVLPLGFVSFYPAQFFFNVGNYRWFIFAEPFIGVVLTVLGLAIWKQGLKGYQSTGS